MKTIEVTNHLASVIEDMRDVEKAERTGLNEYYTKMEEVARAQSGLANLLERARLNTDDYAVSRLCQAIITLGNLTELVYGLHLDRDREYDEFILKPIGDE